MTGWPIFAAVALAVGAAAGACAGHATVQGIRDDAVVTDRAAGAYGVPVAKASDGIEPAMWSDAPAAGDADCTDCSDRVPGYRWAEAQDVRDRSDFRIDSDTFQQGCEAAVRAPMPAS